MSNYTIEIKHLKKEVEKQQSTINRLEKLCTSYKYIIDTDKVRIKTTTVIDILKKQIKDLQEENLRLSRCETPEETYYNSGVEKAVMEYI